MSPPNGITEGEWHGLDAEARAGIAYRWLGKHDKSLECIQKDMGEIKKRLPTEEEWAEIKGLVYDARAVVRFVKWGVGVLGFSGIAAIVWAVANGSYPF